MKAMFADPQTRAFVPLRLAERSLGLKVLAVVLGSILLTVSSWTEVPMLPVPMTMQTFAVLLIGALYGWRLGTLTVLFWLGQAMVGMPVLALGGGAGPASFVGPTAGYLVAFPVIAAMAGWLAERGWTGGNLFRSFAVMIAGHAVCLAMGWAWLSVLVGGEAALAHGVLPFVVGSVVKSALLVATIEATRRVRRNDGET